MTKLYAGIGSRETPEWALRTMTKIGATLDKRGWALRSGAAKGADQAFEVHATKKEIFTAYSKIPAKAYEMAEEFHPAWWACKDFARKLHARNGMIIFGQDMDTPVDMIVCWTKDGGATGGTGQALRIAAHYNLPVFNLFFEDALPKLKQFILEK